MPETNESAVRGLLERWALEVVASDHVAFAFAHMQCVEPTERLQRTPLDFRLTVGLRKVAGRWMIVHEHHSVPAT
ncbi:MAG: nuclear transport factor 2 family protein [Acidobacteriia bacterium]|nr:nuclear transport factor 2 family protein [Terriglobia bacterium]MBV8905328.1 nuclear transport factor 2 family protein [Terriglobia bacterium]